MRSPRSAGVVAVALLALSAPLAACGDDTVDDAAPTTAAGDSGTTTVPATDGPATTAAADGPAKPEVQVPAEAPTELVVTDLRPGEGREAQEGDTVVVHYVGVRTANGEEFDNSYDRGEPFPVTLGQGRVIQGWDEGLVGAQKGARRQLDIPSELAYGNNPQGNVIQAGDALTFVVDVLAVIPVTDPADEPEISVQPAGNVDEVATEDLLPGEGPEVQPGQTVVMHIKAYRADTGEQIASSWETGQLQPVRFQEGATLPGLYQGMPGLREGTRRQITVPFEDAFGADGNLDFGLPAETDMVLVIDVFAIY